MSQALARLRFSDRVAQADVDEAMRLMDASRASVLHTQQQGQQKGPNASMMDPSTRIYSMIREMASLAGNKEVLMDDLREKIRLAGYSEQQLIATIDMFETASIWTLSADERRLVILN